MLFALKLSKNVVLDQWFSTIFTYLTLFQTRSPDLPNTLNVAYFQKIRNKKILQLE